MSFLSGLRLHRNRQSTSSHSPVTPPSSSSSSSKTTSRKHPLSSASSKLLSKHDTKLNQLGEGISGTVTLFQSKKQPSFTYVVKTYHCKENYENKKEYHQRVLHEYHVLSQLHHPNFIQVYKYSISLDGSTVRIFMQRGTSDLYSIFHSASGRHHFGIEASQCLWKQVCNGIQYLHNSQNMCHRDLKLENLVIDPNTGLIKIIDLATAFQYTSHKLDDKENQSVGIVGSDQYLSPETIDRFFYDGKKSDIWSLGIILYYKINHKFPWKSARLSDANYVAFKDFSHHNSDNYEDENYNITQVPPIFNEQNLEIGLESVLRYLPRDSTPLTSLIFQVDPTKRCNIDKFFEITWFNSIKFCDDKGNTCGFDHTIFLKSR